MLIQLNIVYSIANQLIDLNLLVFCFLTANY